MTAAFFDCMDRDGEFKRRQDDAEADAAVHAALAHLIVLLSGIALPILLSIMVWNQRKVADNEALKKELTRELKDAKAEKERYDTTANGPITNEFIEVSGSLNPSAPQRLSPSNTP